MMYPIPYCSISSSAPPLHSQPSEGGCLQYMGLLKVSDCIKLGVFATVACLAVSLRGSRKWLERILIVNI